MREPLPSAHSSHTLKEGIMSRVPVRFNRGRSSVTAEATGTLRSASWLRSHMMQQHVCGGVVHTLREVDAVRSAVVGRPGRDAVHVQHVELVLANKLLQQDLGLGGPVLLDGALPHCQPLLISLQVLVMHDACSCPPHSA